MIKTIDLDKCSYCGICAKVCPTGVIMTNDQGRPVIAYPEDCMTCYNCELECPNECIYVEPFRKPITSMIPLKYEYHEKMRASEGKAH